MVFRRFPQSLVNLLLNPLAHRGVKEMKCFVWDRVWQGNVFAQPAIRRARAEMKINCLKENLGFEANPGDWILDAGCGSGEVSLRLWHLYGEATHIVSIDKSAIALSRLARLADGLNLPLFIVRGDVTALPLADSSFDKICAFGILEHIPDEQTFLTEMHRVLRSHGKIYLTQSNTRTTVYWARRIRQVIGRWPYGYQKNYTPHEFAALLQRYFRLDGLTILHTARDFSMHRVLDRVLSTFLAKWGRYLIARCAKEDSDEV